MGALWKSGWVCRQKGAVTCPHVPKSRSWEAGVDKKVLEGPLGGSSVTQPQEGVPRFPTSARVLLVSDLMWQVHHLIGRSPFVRKFSFE